MLGDSEAFSGFAVKDIDAAAAFYGDTLGLSVTKDDPCRACSGCTSPAAATCWSTSSPTTCPATYTILNFPVADIDAAVDALAGKGVTFERYDGMDRTRRASCAAPGPADRLVHRPVRQHPVRPADRLSATRQRARPRP